MGIPLDYVWRGLNCLSAECSIERPLKQNKQESEDKPCLNCLSAECSIESWHKPELMPDLGPKVSIAFRLNVRLRVHEDAARSYARGAESQLPFG